MRTVLLWVLSVALFVVAAKAHGRELRLEREAAGFHHVVFGGENPAFVQALWRRERVYFWGLTALLEIGVVVALASSGAPRGFIAPVALTWVPALSFAVLG